MKKIFLQAGVALSLLLGAGACNQQAEVSPASATDSKARKSSETKPQMPALTYDPDLELFAQSLAASLADPAVRSFVKAEASKQFDGDYDILYSQVKDKTAGKASFEQTLAQL